jgi:hypothetical protein
LVEPVFVLVSEFESNACRLFQRERKLVTFYTRMRYLAGKYGHIPDFAQTCDLLETVVFLKFAERNHDLSLVAHALSLESKTAPLEDIAVTDEQAFFLDRFFEAYLNDRAVAAVSIPLMFADDGIPDEEEDPEEEEMLDPMGDSERSEQRSIDQALADLHGEAQAVHENDARRRIYAIGASVIRTYALAANWQVPKLADCQREFAAWLACDLNDRQFELHRDVGTQLFWTVLGQDWEVLREFAPILLSLPASEVENERTFSIRKYVVGDRGARSKNDLVTARIRLRLKQ